MAEVIRKVIPSKRASQRVADKHPHLHDDDVLFLGGRTTGNPLSWIYDDLLNKMLPNDGEESEKGKKAKKKRKRNKGRRPMFMTALQQTEWVAPHSTLFHHSFFFG